MSRRRKGHTIAGWSIVAAGLIVVGLVLYQVLDRAFYIDSIDGTDYTSTAEWLAFSGGCVLALTGLVYLWTSRFFASRD
jgi:hypothetical protein